MQLQISIDLNMLFLVVLFLPALVFKHFNSLVGLYPLPKWKFCFGVFYVSVKSLLGSMMLQYFYFTPGE